MKVPYVAQDGLKLVSSSDDPLSCYSDVTGAHHHSESTPIKNPTINTTEYKLFVYMV